jgi:autotransporter adhesin
MENTSSASDNTAAGAQSMRNVSTGERNSGFGASVGASLTTGDDNVIVGSGADSAAGSTSGATVVGRGAVGGSDSVALGESASASAAGAVAIGQGASASAAGAVAIGQGASNSVGGTVSIEGEVRLGGGLVLSSETVSVAGGASQNPSLSVTMSVVSVTSAGVGTGTLADGSAVGQVKCVVMAANAGTRYQMSVTNGVEAGGGAMTSISYEFPGQGSMLVWTGSAWMILNSGGRVL